METSARVFAPRSALQPPLWHDRWEAGEALAAAMQRWRGDPSAVVIGLPRGGVVVAAALAEALQLPLASWAVRKLAHPQAPEVAVGAIAPGGVLLWDEPYLRQLHLDPQLRRELVATQDRELHRRQRLYGDPPASSLRGRTLLVVDDGIATGLTVRAALQSLRQTQPARLVLAIPASAGPRGSISAGAWKHSDLPPPVGSTSRLSRPSSTACIASRWSGRKSEKPQMRCSASRSGASYALIRISSDSGWRRNRPPGPGTRRRVPRRCRAAWNGGGRR